MSKNVFEKIYEELKRKYGKPSGQWQLWCQRFKTQREREEVVLGAVLTQRTNWQNVELAINNLKKAKINSLKNIYRKNKRSLSHLIKPSGFYKTKSRYLISLIKFIFKNYGGLAKMKKRDAKELREKLLNLKGIGQETADSILLYAFNKPIFVIDAYTIRIFNKLGYKEQTYEELQKLFMDNLPKDERIFNEYHALLVELGKNYCKNKPLCDECPINNLCLYNDESQIRQRKTIVGVA